MPVELSARTMCSRVDMWRHRGGMSCTCPARLEVSRGIMETNHTCDIAVTLEFLCQIWLVRTHRHNAFWTWFATDFGRTMARRWLAKKRRYAESLLNHGKRSLLITAETQHSADGVTALVGPSSQRRAVEKDRGIIHRHCTSIEHSYCSLFHTRKPILVQQSYFATQLTSSQIVSKLS